MDDPRFSWTLSSPPCKKSLSFACFILAYMTESAWIEKDFCWVAHALHVARIVSNPRLITGYLPQLHRLRYDLLFFKRVLSLETKNQFEEKKHDWLVQKFGTAIQAQPPFLLLTQEVKRKLCSHGTSFLLRIYHLGYHTTAYVVALGKYPKMSSYCCLQ